jgi:hypothetical protein
LNDPIYVEAARVLAQRTLQQAGPGAVGRLTWSFRLCTGRRPQVRELEVLGRLLAGQMSHYRQDPEAAEALAGVGEFSRPQGLEVGELAAWTALANVLLNLDETVTKE